VTVLVAAFAALLVPIAVTPSPSPTAITCGDIGPRMEQTTKAISEDRPVSPPYVDTAHRPAMLAAYAQADAMVRDLASCVGKYPLSYQATAYELRMTARFYLHDGRWHEDVGFARKGFQECAGTYSLVVAEKCRGMLAQLDRIEARFRRLDALFGSVDTRP
jgi:hypothetical protein